MYNSCIIEVHISLLRSVGFGWGSFAERHVFMSSHICRTPGLSPTALMAQARGPFCGRIGEVLQYSYAPTCLSCGSPYVELCCPYRTIWVALRSQLASGMLYLSALLSCTSLRPFHLLIVLRTIKILLLQAFFSNLPQTINQTDLLLLNTRYY